MRPQQGNFGGKRRGRNRNNNGGGGGHNNHNKPQNILHRSFESTGPDVKVRGNAQHVLAGEARVVIARHPRKP
jgi:hypothetical protein